eukprot:gene11871-2162_t
MVLPRLPCRPGDPQAAGTSRPRPLRVTMRYLVRPAPAISRQLPARVYPSLHTAWHPQNEDAAKVVGPLLAAGGGPTAYRLPCYLPLPAPVVHRLAGLAVSSPNDSPHRLTSSRRACQGSGDEKEQDTTSSGRRVTRIKRDSGGGGGDGGWSDNGKMRGDKGRFVHVDKVYRDRPVGAFHHCTACGLAATHTPTMRVGPKGPASLCNSCGIKYKKGTLVKASPEQRILRMQQTSGVLQANGYIINTDIDDMDSPVFSAPKPAAAKTSHAKSGSSAADKKEMSAPKKPRTAAAPAPATKSPSIPAALPIGGREGQASDSKAEKDARDVDTPGLPGGSTPSLLPAHHHDDLSATTPHMTPIFTVPTGDSGAGGSFMGTPGFTNPLMTPNQSKNTHQLYVANELQGMSSNSNDQQGGLAGMDSTRMDSSRNDDGITL